MILTATLAVVGFGIPLGLAVRTLYRDEALLMLSESAAQAVIAVPASFIRDQDPPELPDFGPDIDAALYDTDGRRLQGTGPERADAAVDAALRGDRAAHRSGQLVVAAPVSENEQVVAVVRVSTPPDVVARRTTRTWAAMAGLAILVVGLAGLIGSSRSRRLARPLSDLRDDAALVGTGLELPERRDSGIPEIQAVRVALAEAAVDLNAAMERERAFSTDVAHQLRTPLTSLRLRLENEQLQTSGMDDLVADVLVDVDRLEQTIQDLVALARDTEAERPWHALATSVRDAAERWAPAAMASGRALTVDTEPHLPWVRTSPGALRQVLDVLLDNALRHGAGEVRLSATRVGTGAVVSVSDRGLRALDPDRLFIRRAASASGSGIGLALARRLAEAENMRLVLADPGPGPVFHLVIATAATPQA